MNLFHRRNPRVIDIRNAADCGQIPIGFFKLLTDTSSVPVLAYKHSVGGIMWKVRPVFKYGNTTIRLECPWEELLVVRLSNLRQLRGFMQIGARIVVDSESVWEEWNGEVVWDSS